MDQNESIQPMIDAKIEEQVIKEVSKRVPDHIREQIKAEISEELKAELHKQFKKEFGKELEHRVRSIPKIQSQLRRHIVAMPPEILMCSGIVIWGRRIKSLVFTTDIAIIRNCNADAVLAVYPFTPQQVISDSIIRASYIPVFAGVGGGTTQGDRTVTLAQDAEAQGAMGLVVNAPMSNENISAIYSHVDIPVVVTVLNEHTDIEARVASGASILNISAAANTPKVVRSIRDRYPDVPIIATGGPTGESIMSTIKAGANAISYTPPTTQELFTSMMADYRNREA